ncbi:MAG TPA: S41 family peptidase [Cyclobacteriaceae bacterium]|nr:S41 family peptidase [Cyclobacteriaceae bacterium]
MKRRLKWIALLIVVVGITTALREPAEKYFDIAKSLDIFATLFKEVNAYYVDEIEPETLIRESIGGMLESLDPYTDYISEDDLEAFQITTTGRYGGIGALIGVVNNKLVITEPYEGFPAQQAGLKIGDEIISVDGKTIKDRSTIDVSALLKGQPKTDVSIKVRRPGVKDELTFNIRREKINLNNVAYYGVIEPGIGYIKLDDFTPGAGKEVAYALLSLKQRGASGLILDLRENPGGILNEAVNIVNIFVPKGEEVVSTRGKVKEWNKTYLTSDNPIDKDIPLVVLTSRGSASASEIVAGALQDYDRAVLIGQKTFGKGLVQTTRPLSYNAQLKVTTAKYYIPSGRCIQRMDYTHRSDDGTVSEIADSLKSEFSTRGGRKVFDGGGLDPDIVVQDQYLGAITIALITKGLIFDYATKYANEKPAPSGFKAFELDDVEYHKFVSWAKSQNLSYSTSLEQSASELYSTAQSERYFPTIENQLKALKATIATNKANDFIRFKSEIKQILEREISFHYALHRGETEYSWDKDEDIIQARKTLIDLSLYNKILKPTAN